LEKSSTFFQKNLSLASFWLGGSNLTTDYLWYKNAVFYQVYVRAFLDSNNDGHGDLRGLSQKLDYFQDLGIDCLWLMPIYPSPLLDDGYDIADFYNIHPDYGNLDDFKNLVLAAHQRGIRIITDLVLNHTSDQHAWFQSARRGKDDPFHEYYVWSDSDQVYKDARIIFLDIETSNWSWDDLAGRYYWHRFYASQPDLNYDNPKVREEMLKVADFWLDLGVDGFRADAVPYLFEREGTICENLPETHVYLKELRRFIDENYPDRILLCEANQWPRNVREYFGDGDEFHMGFHFPLMPRIFMALKKGDVAPLVWVMQQTPAIPDNTQWATFIRNHDELTLEMVTEEERQWMWEKYAPEPRMRLNLGIRRRLAPLLDNDRRKIELAFSLLFTLPGSPVIYYGDEIGMGDNIWLDDRNGVRTPLQWEDGYNAGFSTANSGLLYAPVISDPAFSPEAVNITDQISKPGSLLSVIKKMIEVRKSCSSFGWGDFNWAIDPSQLDTNSTAAYFRTTDKERILLIHNLSETEQSIEIEIPYVIDRIEDLFDEGTSPSIKQGKIKLKLGPYAFRWYLLKSKSLENC
jgi:maltose alpha-D-glucosyltransferase/alpha-amylase